MKLRPEGGEAGYVKTQLGKSLPGTEKGKGKGLGQEMAGLEQKPVGLQQNDQGAQWGKAEVSEASRPVGYPTALGFVLRTRSTGGYVSRLVT